MYGDRIYIEIDSLLKIGPFRGVFIVFGHTCMFQDKTFHHCIINLFFNINLFHFGSCSDHLFVHNLRNPKLKTLGLKTSWGEPRIIQLILFNVDALSRAFD